MDKISLQAAIKEAFRDVPYPGDDNIGPLDGRDDGENVTEFYRGKDWRSLKSNELWGPSLRFMTHEAFHYYFPAYLLACLEDDEDDEDDYTDEFEAHLTPPKEPVVFSRLAPNEAGNKFKVNYSNFTVDQKKVIREYLDWRIQKRIALDREFGDFSGAECPELRKLRDYWKSF